MTRKFLFSSVLLLVLVLASGCSSLTASAAPSVTVDVSKTTMTGNLGIGILLLEGSDQQVTADQAKEMLLLWKGVKLLTSDKSSSALELTALYEQIQENLTADQLSSIREVSYTQQEVAQLMQKYSGGSVTAAAVKKTSGSSSSGGMGGPGGGMGGPGGDMAAISGMSAGTTGTTSSTTTSAQAIAMAASKSSSTSASAGLNAQLADTVIAMLQQRAG